MREAEKVEHYVNYSQGGRNESATRVLLGVRAKEGEKEAEATEVLSQLVEAHERKVSEGERVLVELTRVELASSVTRLE